MKRRADDVALPLTRLLARVAVAIAAIAGPMLIGTCTMRATRANRILLFDSTGCAYTAAGELAPTSSGTVQLARHPSADRSTCTPRTSTP